MAKERKKSKGSGKNSPTEKFTAPAPEALRESVAEVFEPREAPQNPFEAASQELGVQVSCPTATCPPRERLLSQAAGSVSESFSCLAGKELCKRYGAKAVVHNVSLEVRQGEIVGLLGPNGAGKTTTFYMLTGLIKPSGGQVLLDNCDIGLWPLYRRARVGVGYLPQESSIFRQLTVRQNLDIILQYTNLNPTEQRKRADQLLEDFGLTRLEKSFASYLSGGERRRLEIARCLIRDPKFILLDEPFAGIDPLAVGDIQQLIRQLRQRNLGVLISDHNVRETLSICDRASLMFQGRVILQGSPQEIVNNAQARSVYLGESFTLG